jgi:Plavaka transposase
VEDAQTHSTLFVPIILGSDKTTVSVTTGQNKFYPLYISNGNIHNNVWRAHCDGVSILGFLSIPKSQPFTMIYISINVSESL